MLPCVGNMLSGTFMLCRYNQQELSAHILVNNVSVEDGHVNRHGYGGL